MKQKQVGSKINESVRSNKELLLEKFSEPVQINDNKKSIKIEEIDEIISSEMYKIALNIINSESKFSNSKGTKEMIYSVLEFFNKSNLGKCQFDQRAGRNIIKIQKIKGINHIQFIKKFFEIIFSDYLKNYQYEIIDKNNSVSVLFR
ncbi:hypothetical protein [Nitrosopumilus sp.]|uniref:hypothetical protein n=1 Tax=Nitrosopumilus sp. TaxID=2024843 RepID=UPI00262ADBAE|nr:hypothetical protein [Nitrosopumilus sp.]